MSKKPMQERCGAFSRRTGKPCKNRPVEGNKRCRMHGGAAGTGHGPGPTHPRYKHGLYSAEVKKQRQEARKARQELKRLESLIENG